MSLGLCVHVLTAGFTSSNGCAFLYPLLIHKKLLREQGVVLKLYNKVDETLWDCDVLVVESKYFGNRWEGECEKVLEELSLFKEKIKQVFYFSIADSSGWDHAKALPFVTAYLKNQLLVDRDLYLKPMYGNRIFTDYCFHKYQVKDKFPEISEPVEDAKLLSKLGVGWNSGLADWSLFGPIKMLLYRRIKWKKLLHFPTGWLEPSAPRSIDIACRFGTDYRRETVAWQRKKIQFLLSERLITNKLSRRQYFRELESSKIVVSPFGLGEITLKDFEVFLMGGLLFKPDMSHLETWPNFFQDNTTIVTHDWDIVNFTHKLDYILDNYNDFLAIAIEGQDRYRQYLSGKSAGEKFSQHFIGILTKDWSIT